MRKGWGSILLLVFVAMQSFVLSGDSINFRSESWNTVTKDARAEEKLIFVMVTADYCKVCKKMENVLADGNVGKFYNSNFVSTRFDAENTMQQLRAGNWGVTAVPSMIFLDKNKNVLHKAQGYRDAAGMLKEAKTAMRKAGN